MRKKEEESSTDLEDTESSKPGTVSKSATRSSSLRRRNRKQLLPSNAERARKPKFPFRMDFLSNIMGKPIENLELSSFPPSSNHRTLQLNVIYTDRTTDQLFLKLFNNYNDGLNESVMIEKIKQYSDILAVRKVSPIYHGPFFLDSNDQSLTELKGLKMIKYFSVTPWSGYDVAYLKKYHTRFVWNLNSLLRSILELLQVFCANSLDSDFHFYHGDSNIQNYLFREPGEIRMIDFGNSYFCGSDEGMGDFYLSSLNIKKVRNGKLDLQTFFTALTSFLDLPLIDIEQETRVRLKGFFENACRNITTAESVYNSFESEFHPPPLSSSTTSPSSLSAQSSSVVDSDKLL